MTETTLPIHRDEGTGPVLVFSHGFLVDATLWDGVIDRLGDRFRCVAPHSPLGSHPAPMPPGTDLSPPGVADLLARTIEELDLRDVTLVGNDSGGAIAQMVVTRHPERISRLVLTNCDLFEDFPPGFFAFLVRACRSRPLLWLLAQSVRSRLLRRSPLAYGLLTRRPIAEATLRRWTAPVRDPRIRADVQSFARGLDPQQTVDAARELARLDLPVLLAWAREDRFFRVAQAERLAATLPDARIEDIPDSLTFTPLDAPDRLAQLVGDFAAAAAR